MAKGCGSKEKGELSDPFSPQLDRWFKESGNLKALTCNEASSKRGTPRQGLETAPKVAQNLRHEQRRNLGQLPEG